MAADRIWYERLLKPKSFRSRTLYFSGIVSFMALLVACAAFVANDLISQKESLRRSVERDVEIFIQSGASSLAFQDSAFADRLLSGLREVKGVEAASFHLDDGSVFASFGKYDDASGGG